MFLEPPCSLLLPGCSFSFCGSHRTGGWCRELRHSLFNHVLGCLDKSVLWKRPTAQIQSYLDMSMTGGWFPSHAGMIISLCCSSWVHTPLYTSQVTESFGFMGFMCVFKEEKKKFAISSSTTALQVLPGKLSLFSGCICQLVFFSRCLLPFLRAKYLSLFYFLACSTIQSLSTYPCPGVAEGQPSFANTEPGELGLAGFRSGA